MGMTVVEHRSAGLERETWERTPYTSTISTCKGYVHRLHRRVSEALLRAALLKKKAAVFRRARLVRAGNVHWWDEMTNDYDEGGGSRQRGLRWRKQQVALGSAFTPVCATDVDRRHPPLRFRHPPCIPEQDPARLARHARSPLDVGSRRIDIEGLSPHLPC